MVINRLYADFLCVWWHSSNIINVKRVKNFGSCSLVVFSIKAGVRMAISWLSISRWRSPLFSFCPLRQTVLLWNLNITISLHKLKKKWVINNKSLRPRSALKSHFRHLIRVSEFAQLTFIPYPSQNRIWTRCMSWYISFVWASSSC